MEKAEAIIFGVAQKMIANPGVKDELEKIKNTVSIIQAVLLDAAQSSRIITIKSGTGLKSSRMQFMKQMTCWVSSHFSIEALRPKKENILQCCKGKQRFDNTITLCPKTPLASTSAAFSTTAMLMSLIAPLVTLEEPAISSLKTVTLLLNIRRASTNFH